MSKPEQTSRMLTNDGASHSGDARASQRSPAWKHALLATSACLMLACATASTPGASTSTRSVNSTRATQTNAAPVFMLGNFNDDYGGSFSISSTDFVQLPRGRFHIVQWNLAQQYFIAQNDSLNRSDPGKWTRIDWLPLTGMEPYTWAFCFSAYRAATRAEAELAATAKRDTPKTGCAGFPFTRMKPRP